MKAFILAAGKGTRLKHLTADCPKPMLPVGDRPLLDTLVRWVAAHGITEIVVNLHHAPEVITRYLGDGSRFDVSIRYSYEPTLLGTAGALKRQQAYLDEPFVILYGDVFTNLNLRRLIRFHQEQRACFAAQEAISMALYPVPNPTECGLVDVDGAGRVRRFVEKPPPEQVFTNLANTGILVCEPEILERIPQETEYDIGRHLLPQLLAAQVPVFAQPIEPDEVVIDIGTPDGYQRAQEAFRREWAYTVPARAISTGAALGG
jgi:NDP-sugar pyrophosphorylase family protein